jgi:transcriptional regulator with XRE-family HTH domain
MVQASGSELIRSGVDDLDEILGGLLAGDNVVWVSNDPALCAQIERLMLSAAPASEKAIYVSALSTEAATRRTFGENVIAVDARPGSRFSEPMLLEQTIYTAAKHGARVSRVVIEGLASFAQQWGTDRAIAFFKRLCPRLFDLGAIAYWRVPRAAVGTAGIEEIRKVTQCVFELDDRHLRVIKAEGHSALVQGRLFRVRREDGVIRLHAERALGRVAEGLRRLRAQRSLNQAELARLAEVSPSAISQVEAGQRGLSIDTLLTLTGELGIGLDELLENRERPEYVLARRNRGPTLGESRFLLDDPSAGLRVYLVNLASGEKGTPPVRHKGAELVLVARGLVLVDLGSSSPAVRAGDAILATKVPILSWRNLDPNPAVLFWILRD